MLTLKRQLTVLHLQEGTNMSRKPNVCLFRNVLVVVKRVPDHLGGHLHLYLMHVNAGVNNLVSMQVLTLHLQPHRVGRRSALI